MKTVLCCIIFNSILVCPVAAEEPPLQLRITNVGSLIGVSRDDREVLEDQLHVVVMNSSTEEIRIYDQWNSWGYGSLTLSLDFEDTKEKKELTRFGGLQWTANSRGEIVLRPGEQYAYSVWLKDRDERNRTNSWGPLRIRNGDFPWAIIVANHSGGRFADGRATGPIKSPPVRLRLKDQIGID